MPKPQKTKKKTKFDLPLRVIELAMTNLEEEIVENNLMSVPESDLAMRLSAKLYAMSRGRAGRSSSFLLEMDAQETGNYTTLSRALTGHMQKLDVWVEPRADDASSQATPVPSSPQTLKMPIENHRKEITEPELSYEAPSTEQTTQKDANYETPETELPTKTTRSRRLRTGFRYLDVDGSGQLGIRELTAALQVLGTPQDVIDQFLERVDNSGDGIISQEEFISLCELPEFHELAKKMEDLCIKGRKIEMPTYPCMLRSSSPFRIAWDIVIVMLLCALSISVPLQLGFDAIGSNTKTIDLVVDGFFLSDVLLNFRTGFVTKEGFEVLAWKEVALHYLRTWFTVDLVSSVPFDRLVSADWNLTALRLLKANKVVKACRMLKMVKAVKYIMQTSLRDKMEDAFVNSGLGRYAAIMKITASTALLCHWLGCFLAFSMTGCIELCDTPSKDNITHQYVAAIYWAMTTMSTVGYGDITPSTSWERGYAMLSMVIGGAFYGFVIGNITTILTARNVKEQACEARMAEVQAWLESYQFPRSLRLKVRHHCLHHLKDGSTACDEDFIMNMLSTELQTAVGEHMVAREVREHYLFQNLPKGVIGRMAGALQSITAQAGERIVTEGEVGYAMFIHMSGPLKKLVNGDEIKPIELNCGDSFGDEILCGVDNQYRYTILAEGDCNLHSIPAAAFQREVADFPTVPEIIVKNFRMHRGIQPSGPQNFERTVLDALQALLICVEETKSGVMAGIRE